jgi:hypothetical protein
MEAEAVRIEEARTAQGLRFDESKVLLGPYGYGVVVPAATAGKPILLLRYP